MHSSEQSQQAQDPNPVLLFRIFSAALMNITGILSRSTAGSETNTYQADYSSRISKLYSQLSEISQLQRRHTNIIFDAESENGQVFPIGVETLYLSFDQVTNYKQIRDRALELFVETTRESAAITSFPSLSLGMREQIENRLRDIQRDLYASSSGNTFGEIASTLRTAITNALEALSILK